MIIFFFLRNEVVFIKTQMSFIGFVFFPTNSKSISCHIVGSGITEGFGTAVNRTFSKDTAASV